MTKPALLSPLLLIALGLGGCCSTLPHETENQPEFVVSNFVHHVRNERWDQAHKLLSAKTRENEAFRKWRGDRKSSFPITDLNIRNLISNGTTQAVQPYNEDKPPTEYLWVLEDKIPGGPKRVRLFNILIVREASNKKLWRIGLQEHIDRNFSISAE